MKLGNRRADLSDKSRALSSTDKLDFGCDSAEAEEGTVFLQRAFVTTTFFGDVKDFKKWVILGRKGSGKTALCLKLFGDLQKQGSAASLVTPRDLSAPAIEALKKTSLSVSEAHTLGWKNTLTLELSKHVVVSARKRLGGNILKWPKRVRQVRGHVASRLDDFATIWDRALKYVRTFKKLGIKMSPVEVSAEEVTSPLDEDIADKIEANTQCLSKLTGWFGAKQVYILVDKVDEMWCTGIDSHASIVGLLQASREVNEQIRWAKVIVFLRTDIFDSLSFSDADKFHSVESRLQWNEPELRWLVALRARVSTGLTGKPDVRGLWDRFFTPSVGNEETAHHLIRHTLMRPRDLIQLCNLCRDESRAKRHLKILESDVQAALKAYSRWKLGDLIAEYKLQYPFLAGVFVGAFYHTKPRLNRESLLARLNPIKPQLIHDYGNFFFDPIDNLIQVLYNIGFLGAVLADGAVYVFSNKRLPIPYVIEFEIHPAFHNELETEAESPGTLIVAGDISVQGDVSWPVRIAVERSAQAAVVGSDFIVSSSVHDVQCPNCGRMCAPADNYCMGCGTNLKSSAHRAVE